MAMITMSVLRNRSQEYLTQGEGLMKEGKLDHAIAVLYRGLSLAELLDEGSLLHRFRLLITQVLNDQGQAEQVVAWCDLTLAEPIDPDVKGHMLTLKITNLIRLGQFQQADTLISELMNHPEVVIQRTAYLNRGVLNIQLFRYLNQYTLDKAEKYLNEAEQLCRDEMEDYILRARIYYYKALCYVEEGLNYYAREMLQSALRILDQHRLSDARIPQIYILNELGRVSIKLMDYDAARGYLDQARDEAIQTSFQMGLYYNIYYRGLLYMEMLCPEMACTYLLTASFEFLRRKHNPEVALMYLYLSQLYESKNSEKSEKYLLQHKAHLRLCEQVREEYFVEEAYQWMSY